VQLAEVIGRATATVEHPSLAGWCLLVVQPLDAHGGDDGEPLLAIDEYGSSRRSRVLITSDGKAVREMVKSNSSPIRWAVVGIADS